MISNINLLDLEQVKKALASNMKLESLEYEGKKGVEALDSLVTPVLLDSVKRDNFNIFANHFLLGHDLHPTRQRIQVIKLMLEVIKNCKYRYTLEESNYEGVFKDLGLGRN